MAVLQGDVSIQVVDSRNEVTSFDQPFKFDNAVTTWAQFVSWVQGLGVAIDTIIDGEIRKIRVSILIPLPSGIKTAPNAGGDNEKTGLFSMNVVGSPNAYGDDVPSIQNSRLTGNLINQSDAGVMDFVSYITTTVNGITPTDRYENALYTVKNGFLTFRKHRRALRRS